MVVGVTIEDKQGRARELDSSLGRLVACAALKRELEDEGMSQHRVWGEKIDASP
jgi:hypothetical protein